MEKKEEKKIKVVDEFNEDDWESIPENEKTEETKDILYRLNFEKASKVKLEFSKLKNYHNIKVKKLIPKEIESFFQLDKYIKKEYIPNIKVTHNNSNPYVTILNNDYVLKKHPEIGTYLIYEMDDKNQEANLIGKSDTWYEATIFKPKIRIRKPVAHPKNENVPKISKNINLNSGVEKKNENFGKFGKIGNNGNLMLNKKRKRKKKKRIYLKDSTIIEIKRIFDNKEKEKEKEEDNNNQINNSKNINEDEEKKK